MSDRLLKSSFIMEEQNRTTDRITAAVPERSKLETSPYCKYCDFKFHNGGRELPKPVRREVITCRVDTCHFEAIKEGLCHAHMSSLQARPATSSAPKPVIIADNLKPSTYCKDNSEQQSKAEPELKSENHDRCFFCENPVTHLLGRCPKHQEAACNSTKRRCYWTGKVCTMQPKPNKYYCCRHDREKIKIHNAASRRSQEKPAIKDSHILDQLWEKECNEG